MVQLSINNSQMRGNGDFLQIFGHSVSPRSTPAEVEKNCIRNRLADVVRENYAYMFQVRDGA